MKVSRRSLLAQLTAAPVMLAASSESITQVGFFAFGGVGFTGRMSSGEQAYRAIRSAPDAKAKFEELLQTGNPQARCYALVGLWKIDPRRFREEAEKLRNSSQPVHTMRGCVAHTQKMSELVAEIESGAYNSAP